MAAVTLLGSATFTTSSGTKTVTATPAVGDLLVIVAAHSGNTSTTTPTDDQGGIYVLGAAGLKNTSADRLAIYVRTTLVTSAVSTVFTIAPGTSTGGGLAVLKVTGMTRVGANAIRQSQAQANQSASTPAPVLGSAALTTNALIGAVFNATNPAGLTPRTSWTERADVGYNTPASGLEVMSRNSGETATTITWGSSSSAFSSVVLELDITTPLSYTLTAEQGTYTSSGQAAGLLAGWAVSAAQGTYTLTGQDTILSVQSASSGASAPLPSLGLVMLPGFPLTADFGTYSLSGQTAGLSAVRSMSADQGTYTQSGQDAGLSPGNRLFADFGTYALNGVEADLVYTIPPITDGSPAPLPSLGLLYGLGQDAVSDGTPAYLPSMGLLYGLGAQILAIAAEYGTYSISGQDAGGVHQYILTAEYATYTLTGQTAALQGSGAQGGNPGPLPHIGLMLVGTGTYSMFCDAGIYNWVGSDGLLDFEVFSESGTYTLTGQDAGLLKSTVMAAEYGTYSVTGQDAGLLIGGANRRMLADFGTYATTGQDATVLRQYPMLAGQGFYALLGQDATLAPGVVTQYTITADSGTYTLTGQDATLTEIQASISAETGYYTLTGFDVVDIPQIGGGGGFFPAVWLGPKPKKKKKRADAIDVGLKEAAEVAAVAPKPRVIETESALTALVKPPEVVQAKPVDDAKKRKRKKAEKLLLL